MLFFFLFQVQILLPHVYYFILFYFIMFVNIIFCLHRCYNKKLCLLIGEFTDFAPFMHRCCGAGHYNPCLHRYYGAGLLFVYFQLWNGLQYTIPDLTLRPEEAAMLACKSFLLSEVFSVY